MKSIFFRIISLSVVGAGLLVSVWAAVHPIRWFPSAQEPTLNSQQRFIEDTKKVIHADASSQNIAISENRKNTAIALMESSPSAFLQWAIPATVSATLPADIRRNVEQEITTKGELTTTIIDHLDQKTSTTRYSLVTSDGKNLTLHFAQAPEDDLPTGTKVKVHGFSIDKQMAIESADPSPDNEAFQMLSLPEDAAFPQAEVNKKLGVLLFNFDNNPSQPYSVDQIRSFTFTDPDSVNAYYREVSNGKWNVTGKLRADGDVFGWFTVPYDPAISDCFPQIYKASQSAREQARLAGIDLSGYDNLMFVTAPVSFPCDFGGWGDLRGINSWILGTFKSPSGYGVPIHELGHNFGAGHANSISCFDKDRRPVPISAKCTRQEQGDPFDVMGSVFPPHHLSAFHKGQFNFFTPGNTKDVDPTGLPPEGSMYSLSPAGPPSSGVKTLRIVRTHDPTIPNPRYYYVEYRRPYGRFDNFSAADPITQGVSIRIAPDYSATLPYRPKTFGDSWLVDASIIDDQGFFNPVLPPGQTFTDPYRGIAIETLSVSPASATVRIKSIPLSPCQREAPYLKIFPETQWGNPGQTVSYKLSVQNNDTFACGPGEFSVSIETPAGWNASFDNTNLTIDPERTGRAVLSLASPQGSAEGLFSHRLTVSRPHLESPGSDIYVNYMVYTVDHVAPTVKIVAPWNKEIVSGSFFLYARATDNIGVGSVSFFLDGGLLQSVTLPDPYFSYRWDTNTVADGNHVITAKAFDTSGNSTLSDPVTVTVDNLPPTPTPTPTPLPPVPEPVVNNFTIQAVLQHPDGNQTVLPTINAVGVIRFEDEQGNALKTRVNWATCMSGGALSLPIASGGTPCSAFAPGRYATQWKTTVKTGGATYTLISPTTCTNKTCSIREQSEMITGGRPIHRGVYQAPAPKPLNTPKAIKAPKAGKRR